MTSSVVSSINPHFLSTIFEHCVNHRKRSMRSLRCMTSGALYSTRFRMDYHCQQSALCIGLTVLALSLFGITTVEADDVQSKNALGIHVALYRYGGDQSTIGASDDNAPQSGGNAYKEEVAAEITLGDLGAILLPAFSRQDSR